MQAQNSTGPKERKVTGKIFNAVTGAYVNDSIRVDILTPDSVVVATGHNRFYHELEYRDGAERQYIFEVPFCAEGEDFIIRLSYADYADAYYPIKISGMTTDAGRLKMRKLTQFEKTRMLDEVVVKASVLQVVNKGDTIQYNADAFAIAQGSMLDALIEQLPGVELRDGGRIYVNGRFVDKLLLDGKDFFQGDQFVLLQNLPAYTVKNVKVYEQASDSKEVFGHETMSDPDKYVMDVTMRKGYNTGWMANAQAGAGTHDRYQGRLFGMGYTRSWRLGVFGLMNNINETRNPGRDGEWDPARDNSGRTTSKAGGLSYGYFAPDRTTEFTGATSAQYGKATSEKLTNIQNFLEGSDTYIRRWNDNLNREISVKTDNDLRLRPKEGNRYRHTFSFRGSYEERKTEGRTSEGTFLSGIGDLPDLRERLDSGWIDGEGLLNRYVSSSESHYRKYTLNLSGVSLLNLPHDNGLKFIAAGKLSGSDTKGPNFNDYQLEYSDGTRVTNRRSNPEKSHGYNYNIAVELDRPLNEYINITPRIDLYKTYEYKDNQWLIDSDTILRSQHQLPSMRADALLRYDPRNSYATGTHYTNLRPWLQLSYFRKFSGEDKPISEISAYLDMQANILRQYMNFRGVIDSRVGKNYIVPSLRAGLTMNFLRNTHTIQLSYGFYGSELDMFNLIDGVVFDSDPLNRRMGNPDLKQTLTHFPSLYYYNRNWMMNRLRMYARLYGYFLSDQTAMSYSYDRATGVRTFRPINVNGNRQVTFTFGPTVALDRAKRFQLTDQFTVSSQRSVDMMSDDNFENTQRSVVNSLYFSNNLSLQYSVSKFTVGADGQYETRRSTSAEKFFDSFRITQFRYGIRGRVSLPAGMEVSTDLKMYSNRGFDSHVMNTNQLVWNGRVTKSFLKGNLMLMLDGYDILGNVKNITYNVNAQGRTETWVNSIPSYVMLSLRWNFAKKPKE